MKRMKFEGENAFEMQDVQLYRCTRPELDCIWCLTREELVEAEKMGERSTGSIPMFEGHICNCNPMFSHAVEEARRLGCGLLE